MTALKMFEVLVKTLEDNGKPFRVYPKQNGTEVFFNEVSRFSLRNGRLYVLDNPVKDDDDFNEFKNMLNKI